MFSCSNMTTTLYSLGLKMLCVSYLVVIEELEHGDRVSRRSFALRHIVSVQGLVRLQNGCRSHSLDTAAGHLANQ